MNLRLLRQLPVILLVLATGANFTRADEDLAANARKALRTYENALVTLRLTLKVSAHGHSMESKRDVVATIVDPSGLSVTALDNVGGKAEITESRMRLADGSEVPVRVVLKDEELGLALVAPEAAPSKENAAVIAVLPLSDGAKVEPLDECFVLGRTDKQQSFVVAVQTGRLIAKQAKPRLVYLASVARLGCPVFDANAKLIGFFARPQFAGEAGSPVILPAADVARNVPQALEEAAKPAPKEAPATGAATQDSK